MGDNNNNNNNKRRMTSLSSLLLASSLLGGWHFVPSYGFLLSPRPIVRKYYDNSAIYQYDDGNNNNNDDFYFSNRSNNSNRRKKDTTKNQQTKKRRFAQEIHPQKKFQDFDISYSNTATTSSSSSSSSSTNKKKKDKKAKTNNNNNNNNNNIFLQTSKSIEELERTMTQRYGTKLEQWTFDANNDSEYELVFDDNNNNNNSKGRNYSDDDNIRPKRKKGKFKGKPVMDPWAKMGSGTIISDDDDNDNEDEENSPPKNKKEKHTKRKLAAAAAAASVAGINPNKETNHQKSNNRNVGPSKLEQKQGKKNSFIQKTEFYDEDDIGYEEENVYDIDIYDSEDDDNNDFYNRVISPKPVGGRGKKKKNVLVEPPRPSKKSNDDDNFSGGGFFSRATQAAASSTSAQEVETPTSLKKNHPSNNNNLTSKMEPSSDSSEESKNIQHSDNDNKKNKKVKKVTKSSPLLDAKGKKMFLTLDHVPSICATAVIKDDAAEEEEDESTATAISWEDIGITHPILLENLRKYMSCPTPLPVQIQSSSAILQNKSDNDSNDIIISTPTGSGKTLAFLVPLVQQLLDEEDAKLQQTSTNNKKKKKPTAKQLRAVVIAPGRELASQIIQVTRDLLRSTGMSSQLAIGGTPFTRTMEQIRKKKPTILVGTPGRLAELIVGSSSNDNNGRSNKRIKIPATNHIVLDECDALLGISTADDDERASTNNGYSNPHAEPTNAILHALKRQHPSSLQTILCSATATDLILSQEEDDTNGLVKKDKYRNYDMIQLPHQDGLAATTTSPTALHGIVHVPHKRFQLDTLKKILHTHPMPAQVLIFVNTPHRVKIIVQKLAEMGIIAAPFTGDEQKQDRTDVNKALREGYVGIVVATEMAARGIDAPYLTHVINYDLPTDASHYAHRAGRVARGGRPGIVINMTTSARERHVPYSKFAKPLKLENQMFVVEARDGKLPIIGSSYQPKTADSSD